MKILQIVWIILVLIGLGGMTFWIWQPTALSGEKVVLSDVFQMGESFNFREFETTSPALITIESESEFKIYDANGLLVKDSEFSVVSGYILPAGRWRIESEKFVNIRFTFETASTVFVSIDYLSSWFWTAIFIALAFTGWMRGAGMIDIHFKYNK